MRPSFTTPDFCITYTFKRDATSGFFFIFDVLWKENLIVFLFVDITVCNGTWHLNTRCNVSCGYGMETWRRSCDNFQKIDGQNCTVLTNDVKYTLCKRPPCAKVISAGE